MIAVIDYGMGNIQSVLNACEALGTEAAPTSSKDDIQKASGIILPGVGAFEEGMENLRSRNLVEILNEAVQNKKKPFLGICLGLQFLAECSEEHKARCRGLSWIKGAVRRMKPESSEYKIPHMGWNDLHIEKPSPLFEGLKEKPAVYFVHSYHLVPAPEEEDVIIATTDHGMTVTAAVQKGHIFGVQFHPEKSQSAGLLILKNFLSLCKAHA